MNPRTAPGDSDLKLQDAITKVGLLTYMSLIMAETPMRAIVKGQVDHLQASGSVTAAQRAQAVKVVTDAMTEWGFPAGTIDGIRNGKLGAEANLFDKFKDTVDGYSLTGCTKDDIQPALKLL